MLYLNQAGTSWPKPQPVRDAVQEALAAPVETWPETFDQHHQEVCEAFGVPNPQRMLLTPGATSALSVAILDHRWQPGDRVLVSALEHHALQRPVQQLADRGVEVGILPPGDGAPLALEALEAELRRGRVRMVAVTAACNVTGDLLPIAEIIALAHEHDALALVDAAQIAGWQTIDVMALHVDLLAFTGHKGPQAPWGIGGLFVAEHVAMASPAAACELPVDGQPACAAMPGYCDVGSVDRAALAGLAAGLRWLAAPERSDRLRRARRQVATVQKSIGEMRGVTCHAFTPPESRMPTVALTVDDRSPAELAAALAQRNVLVGTGLQCAPLAHETLGTAPEGVLRISFGPGSAADDEEVVVTALRDVLDGVAPPPARPEPRTPAPNLDQHPLPEQLALKDRALASAAEGITISDLRMPDNPLIYVNDGFTQITGYSREESIGRNCRYLQGPDTSKEKTAEIRNAVAARRGCVVELLNHRRDGTPFWNRLSLTPLRDASGEVTHYIGVQSDVTRERESEEALREAKERLEQANQRMQIDLRAAAGIQRALLPEQLPNGDAATFAWHLDSCDELAGDTLNVIPLDDDHIGLYVLDVSGHGVPAALLSVTLHHWLSPDPNRSVLRTSGPPSAPAARIMSPDLVARQLNAQFPMDMESGQYFTLFYGILNLPLRELRYVIAGHPPPIHVPAQGEPYQLESTGMAIGWVPDAHYETQLLVLAPGDRLYLFSDGLPESTNEDGEHFDIERLLADLASRRTEELTTSLASIVDRARRWRGYRALDDDLTLLGIEIA